MIFKELDPPLIITIYLQSHILQSKELMFGDELELELNSEETSNGILNK